MRKRLHILSGAVLAMVVPVLACSSSDEDVETTGDARIGAASQAMVGGQQDLVNAYMGVGYLHQPGRTPFCTAILVAPRWVLTARHCFNSNPLNGTYRFGIGANGNVPGQYVHTNAVSGDVLIPAYFWNQPNPPKMVWWGDSSDTAHDVALVQLDQPVPVAASQFLRVASVAGHPNCEMGADGLATQVGYHYCSMLSTRRDGSVVATRIAFGVSGSRER